MAPESDAHARALYDHENDEPRRRRRTAADWGVNEDIFDRMPSRFGRVERRVEHQEIVLRRGDGSSMPVVERAETERAESPSRGAVTARTERVSRGGEAGELDPRAAARAVMSWGEDLDDAPMVPGETRTIVLSRDAIDYGYAAEGLAAPDRERDDDARSDDVRGGAARGAQATYEPMLAGELARDTGEYTHTGGGSGDQRERKTIKISGHPDRLPARTQRAPRTAVERIGHRPDRIVAYAVALGFLLVLIAVLTTGQ